MSDAIPKLLGPDRARLAAMSLAGVRGAVGITALVAPSALLAPWVGRADATSRGAKLLGRSLGGRDLALAAGPLLAIRHDAPVRGWIEAGMLADVADSAATLLAFGRLPRRTRWLVLASTIGAAAAGLFISASVDGVADSSDDELDDDRPTGSGEGREGPARA